MKEIPVINEKVIQKFFSVFIKDCRVKLDIHHDVDLDFEYFYVTVYSNGCLPLRVLHEFDKYMKKQYNLDCCDLNFDFGRGSFDFELF